MSVRRPLLLLCCAFALGLAAAALVACGGTTDGIPSADASNLDQQLGDVQEFVQRGECGGLNGQLRQVQEGIDNLPSSVDPALVDNLQQGLDRLRDQSVEDCNDTRTEPAETTETVPETVPQTTPETVPETTPETVPETTPQTPTETTPQPPVETTPTTPETPGEGGAGVDGGTDQGGAIVP